MSALQILLACAAALLALAPPAVAPAARAAGALDRLRRRAVVCAVACAVALAACLAWPPGPTDVTLPLGLPWIGARFHLDALAAVFLRRGQPRRRGRQPLRARATAATRPSRERVLPFYPVFLAGMNLVVLAADAFSFLVAWELMSLASWGW